MGLCVLTSSNAPLVFRIYLCDHIHRDDTASVLVCLALFSPPPSLTGFPLLACGSEKRTVKKEGKNTVVLVAAVAGRTAAAMITGTAAVVLVAAIIKRAAAVAIAGTTAVKRETAVIITGTAAVVLMATVVGRAAMVVIAGTTATALVSAVLVERKKGGVETLEEEVEVTSRLFPSMRSIVSVSAFKEWGWHCT
jgi:hypothetical protein